MILSLLININISHASIEIKDSTSVLTNKTISQFYDMAEEMKLDGEGLEGTTVDVKMANDYEWAAVSYFSNGVYGTAGAGENTGTQLPDTTHYSTNGNITGVIDWGKNWTYTAGIIKSYLNNDGTLRIAVGGGQSILDNVDTDRVNKFIRASNTYAALVATTGWYGAITNTNDNPSNPYSIRKGLFSIESGGYGQAPYYEGHFSGAGFGNPSVTFRPVFYAQ